jgi:hypothetical protein
MIWLEPVAYQLRVIDGDPAERPPYRATGLILVHEDTAVLKGFCGRITRPDIAEFYRELRRKGFRFAIAERTGNHRVPFGTRIEAGEFTGWWRVDLERFDG